jgi:hypothetical protein
MKCPKCAFPDWKSLKMIHEEGTVVTESSSSGGGFGGGIGSGGIGVGGARGSSTSSGQSMSKLAARAAPPDNDTVYGIIGLIFTCIVSCLIVGWWLGPNLHVFFLIAISFITLGVKYVKKDCKDYELAMEVWRTHAACLRCGEFFKMPTEDTTSMGDPASPPEATQTSQTVVQCPCCSQKLRIRPVSCAIRITCSSCRHVFIHDPTGTS